MGEGDVLADPSSESRLPCTDKVLTFWSQGQPYAYWTNCSKLGPAPGKGPTIYELDDATLSISAMALVTG